MTDSMEKVSLFFSWQSDRKDIRKAIFAELKNVKEQLAQDGIELIVDQDTRGRKGTEKIDVALLKKIRDCDIFLADMSPVTTMIQEIDEDVRRTKLIPNPNVMFEYGYATGFKGIDYVLSVIMRFLEAYREHHIEIIYFPACFFQHIASSLWNPYIRRFYVCMPVMQES